MPYEEIQEEEYNVMLSNMKEFNIKDLYQIEKQETISEVEECTSGG